VAVKVLELPLARDRVRLYARFKQEFERLRAAGNHPGIVRCHESGVQLLGGQEYPWYSMELAVGDLGSRIQQRRAEAGGRLPWTVQAMRAEIVREFEAVAAAVAHLHGQDIVHRDIKPGNVLIMDDGGLRLADFGLVKMLDALDDGSGGPRTSTGARLGTEHYMAPEQARGEEVGKPADVYALAVVLGELALGERPEPDLRVTEGSTLKNSERVQRLPKGLRQFLGRCTEASPERRPPDAAVLGEEFAALLKGGSRAAP
jgi:serine/threonine-protein kinase